MLPRVLEPEVMDTPEEARDYDAMDHAQVNRVFVIDFLAVWDRRGPVLDVGTGTALIPIEFCRQWPTGSIVAVDAAAHMLDLACENVRRAGFDSRITCQLVDAKRMPFADRSFPAVMSNSIVHHIPDPRTVFAEIARVAMPGATIFVRDLLRPPDLETLVNGVDVKGKKVRFLRKIPEDPMTHSTDWGLRSMQDEPDSDSWGGQNVFDVYTKSDGTALNGMKYKDW